MIPLLHYLIVAAILFGIGLAGIVINRSNVIVLLMCIELLLLGANTNFIAFANHFNNAVGEVFVFFILTVAAAEAAIGLAIVMLVYRQRHSIDTATLNELKG